MGSLPKAISQDRNKSLRPAAWFHATSTPDQPYDIGCYLLRPINIWRNPSTVIQRFHIQQKYMYLPALPSYLVVIRDCIHELCDWCL